MNLLPLALNLQGRRCVIIGAGNVARRKAISLLDCEAHIVVIAPHFDKVWHELNVQKITRLYQSGDCNGATLVFACTNAANVNRQIAAEAKSLNTLCNIADNSEAGSFHSMATLRRGEICIGVSTSGNSPALSRHLKEKISATIGPEYESLLELLAARRAALPQTLEQQSQRAAFWRAVLQSDILDLLRAGQTEAAEKLIDEFAQTNQ